ncbi:MAG: hypothetical protein M3N98_11260 [Actinomycetota bacterium]|nr:hypothetical protein [Actinomycetota bacterium]
MSVLAELSSVATGLDEMTQRITALATGLTGAEAEALSSDLFEVERALGTASRRLSRILDAHRT